MHQALLGGADGVEGAHDRADHVEVDIQRNFGERILVRGAVRLGAEQAALLAAAEDQTQAAAARLSGERLRDAKQADAAGHVVIRAGRERPGIVMRGEHDPLVRLAGQLADDIVGLARELVLLEDDPGGLRAGADQPDGGLGVDVHAGNLHALAHIGAQLTLVDILIGVVGVAVVGDEAGGAACKQVLILPVAQEAVQQHDFAFAGREGAGVGLRHIDKRRFDFAAAGAQIALAGNLPAVDGQAGMLHGCHRHVERLKPRGKAELLAFTHQIPGAGELLLRAAYADIGGVVQNAVDGFYIHGRCLLVHFIGSDYTRKAAGRQRAQPLFFIKQGTEQKPRDRTACFTAPA